MTLKSILAGRERYDSCYISSFIQCSTHKLNLYKHGLVILTYNEYQMFIKNDLDSTWGFCHTVVELEMFIFETIS